jgi:hypothetical protein
MACEADDGSGTAAVITSGIKEGLTMTGTAEVLDEVALSSLDKGSVIDVETKSRRYRIEYLGGDEAWISGHPKLCPRPVRAQIDGSIGRSGIEPGSIRQGMHLVFRLLGDDVPVTTSEITGISTERG